MPTLHTPRLTLRPPLSQDLQGLNRVYGNTRAMRYWSTPPHTLKQTEKFLELYLERFSTLPTYFVIEQDGQILGTCGLHSGTEVGYILHPDYWRKGFVTEAMTAAIGHIFETTTLPLLTADIDPRNHASHASLIRLGFTRTGFGRATFCVAGEVSDSWYYTRWRL